MSTCVLYARLELPGVDPLLVDPAGTDGLALVDLDLGFPTVREVVEDRPDADGTTDLSAFFGARAVTMTLVAKATATATKQQVMDRLGRFLVPRWRPTLYWMLEDGGDERRMTLRGSQLGAPMAAPVAHVAQQVQVGWAAPNGIQEAADLVVFEVFAAAPTTDGITFPITFPVAWPASSTAGTVEHTVAGELDVSPVLRLYGPAVNPRIENVTTDRRIELTAEGGLTLAAGEYVDIDVAERTIRLLSDSDQSRLERMDYAASTWWQLQPGLNVLRYYPDTFDAGAVAEVRYRPAWL